MKATYNPAKGKKMPKTYQPKKSSIPEHYTQGKASKKQ